MSGAYYTHRSLSCSCCVSVIYHNFATWFLGAHVGSHEIHVVVERTGAALHWDMVCDLRQKGEVWVDDVLFLKDGKIVV